MKEEFKLFVRERPYLIKSVNEGTMTWQKFYEIWRLYGEDDKVWNEYKQKETINSKSSFDFKNINEWIKKIDMNQVQKGINSMQKIIELLQGFSLGSLSKSEKEPYKPREIFKKFED